MFLLMLLAMNEQVMDSTLNALLERLETTEQRVAIQYRRLGLREVETEEVRFDPRSEAELDRALQGLAGMHSG